MHIRFFSRKSCAIGMIGKPNRAYLKLPPPLEPTATGLFNGHAREVMGVDYAPRGPLLVIRTDVTAVARTAPGPRAPRVVLASMHTDEISARMRRVSDCPPKMGEVFLIVGSFQNCLRFFFVSARSCGTQEFRLQILRPSPASSSRVYS